MREALAPSAGSSRCVWAAHAWHPGSGLARGPRPSVSLANFLPASPYIQEPIVTRGGRSDEGIVARNGFPGYSPAFRRRPGSGGGGHVDGGGLAAVPGSAAERGLGGDGIAPELAGERSEGPLEEAHRKRIFHRGRGRGGSLHHGRGRGERGGLPAARVRRRGGLAHPLGRSSPRCSAMVRARRPRWRGTRSMCFPRRAGCTP